MNDFVALTCLILSAAVFALVLAAGAVSLGAVTDAVQGGTDMQRKNGRRHLTKEQLRALLVRKDGAAQKHIPESARWQMEHRPYQRGEDNADKRERRATDSLESRRQETTDEEI